VLLGLVAAMPTNAQYHPVSPVTIWTKYTTVQHVSGNSEDMQLSVN